MESPFTYGKVATGSHFSNRKEEKQRLVSNFTNGINTILISPRRWGKTSLVREVATDLGKRNKKIRFCFIDLFKIRTEQEFYEKLTAEVLKSSGGKLSEWMELAKTFLKNLTPKFNVHVAHDQDFSVSLNWKDLQKQYDEALNLCEKIAARKKIRIVICIDEFQNLSNFDDPMVFQKRLRASWQHHKHVSYCLYGSKRSMMAELFEKQSMPFFKFGDLLYLQKIETKHLRDFIVQAFNRTNKAIMPEMAVTIVETMKQHPYYVQQLAHMVWVKAPKKVTTAIIQQAIDELLTQNALFYQKEVDSLSNTQLNFLKALVNEETAFSSAAILKEYKLGTSANINKIKTALDKREVIDNWSGKAEFVDPVFQLWFKKCFIQN